MKIIYLRRCKKSYTRLMRVNIWETDTRLSCMRMDYIMRDLNTDKTCPVSDIFYDTFRRAYSMTGDWPMPQTRVDTYVQDINQDTPNSYEPHLLAMREYIRSRGFHGNVLTRPNSSHIVRTVLRMTGVSFRETFTTVLSECILGYSDKVALVVLECPQTWLFVEAAIRLMEQCTDGRHPKSDAIMYLASLLPSKNDWCKLCDEMKLKIGSVEANTHLWCWFRLQHLFSDYVNYTQVWTSGGTRMQNSAFKRAWSM